MSIIHTGGRLLIAVCIALTLGIGSGCTGVPMSDATPPSMPVAGDGFRRLAASNRPLQRIAFGSCARQDKPQPIWDAILAANPDLFVFTGDNVYGDWRYGLPSRNGASLSSLRAAYADASRIENFNRLRASVPFMATWDDHDFGLNDAGGEFPYKAGSQELFVDFWHLPDDDPRRRRAGVYSRAHFGPQGERVTVVLLDTRYFRSGLRRAQAADRSLRGPYRPDESPGLTMLGEAQWQWLGAAMAESTEVLVLVSSIQVLADGHGFERWGNLPREWQRLMDMIAASPARAVVILSGDRHHGSLYRLALPGGREVTEITSSGLTQVVRRAQEPGVRRIGDLVRQRNFGMLAFDWSHRRVTAQLMGEQGQVLRRILIDIP